MNPVPRISHWLDIRSGEFRPVAISFVGAFLVLSFAILARSFREALYLAKFDVKTLPYITAGVAALGLPTVTLFSRLLTRYRAKKVFQLLIALLAAGIGALWPLLERLEAAVILFYLWTALGTMVLTSAFWLIASEHFSLRGAKRLFGLISAGGTLGAMAAGISLRWLTKSVEVFWLVPALTGILILFLLAESLLPQVSKEANGKEKGEALSSLREGASLVWRHPHLRTIGLVVLTATIASTLLDYQFKESVRAAHATKESLASFFGAFYGWTGAAALGIQLLLASRLMAWAGVGRSLAILPSFLLLGSVGILILPGIFLATLVRGTDNSLRKSLHRSVLEVLFVPLPPALRRKTKGFIDSVLDSTAEGIGAGIVFLWVTLANQPSRILSAFTLGLAGGFLYLCRRMDRQYFRTVVDRLQEGEEIAGELMMAARFDGRDLLSATFTRLEKDFHRLTPSSGDTPSRPPAQTPSLPLDTLSTLSKISASDTSVVSRALEECRDWGPAHIPVLARLLAQDPLADRVTILLASLGPLATPHLITLLKDPETDFAIRRRIPRILAKVGGPEADDALLDLLQFPRFEVRYRAGIALVQRRRRGLPTSDRSWQEIVWEAIRYEVNRERPVWEAQRLLDQMEETDKDELAERRVGSRGALSLEHTFRLLTLVLDPKPVRTAYQGLLLDHPQLKGFALEYLEQVLPEEVRRRLWPFIGDWSEVQKEQSIRPLGEVVSDLIKTEATLFATDREKDFVRKWLKSRE